MPADPLPRDVSPTDAFHAAAAALLDDAVSRLENPGDPDKVVHETRKRIKEFRALLRLCGDALVAPDSKPVRRRENAAVRSAARSLGDAREAHVAARTLASVAKTFKPVLKPRAFQAAADLLAARRDAAAPSPHAFADAAAVLGDVRERLDACRLPGDFAFDDPIRGLYKKARDAHPHPHRPAADETWHAWRKRVKDLRYALEFLGRTGPPYPAVLELSDLLGDEHDLSDLADLFENPSPPAPSAGPVASAVTALARAARQPLRERARLIGGAVFGEKPKAFAARTG